MQEAKVTIDGKELSFGQVMAMRVAVSNFLAELNDTDYCQKLGPIADGYKARLREVETMLIEGATPEKGVKHPCSEPSNS